MPFDTIAFTNRFQVRQPTIPEDDILMYRRYKYFKHYIREECPAEAVSFIRAVIVNHGLMDDVIEKMNYMIEEDIDSDYVLPKGDDVAMVPIEGHVYKNASYGINLFRCPDGFWVNMTTEHNITPAFKW
jgi:hypothetical protein